ncbi:hypothetical protein FB451DRAFT_1300004 [Mycena latifolia]|nr:hypothetical protein FB451DRAFT_1300004 [Mycena latifolia]
MSGSRILDHSRSLNVSSPLLLAQLNELLASLDLPFTIQSHKDLTPSLLICILESLLTIRLDISTGKREKLFTSGSAKVHCMKIFLGVLQSDILQQDVGISSVDPRRLAGGEDEETIYICRLLCWYGRRQGLIARRGKDGLGHESRSPSTLTSITRQTDTSPMHAFSSAQPGSDTSVSLGSDHEHGGRVSPAPNAVAPRCIHEVPSPSLILSPATPHPELDSGFERTQNATVRYTGYINIVDQDAEIAAFESQREQKKRMRFRRLEKRPQQQARTDVEVSVHSPRFAITDSHPGRRARLQRAGPAGSS